jgi:hypothetical protein
MADARPKAHKGVGMEGFLAAWHARETPKDLDEFKGIARRIAAHIGPGARVLEVAPGPALKKKFGADRGNNCVMDCELAASRHSATNRLSA